MKTLLSNATIVASGFEVIKQGFVGIDGEAIDYVGADRPSARYDSELDMKGHILMPGLYNLHTHTSMVLLRGLGSDLPLDRWLTEAMFPIEARLTADDISVGTRLAMMEMMATGTVSCTDMYDMARVTVEETLRAGMKMNVCRPILGFDQNEAYTDNFRVTESLAFFDELEGKCGDLVKIDMGIHAEYTSFDELVRFYALDSKKRGARIHLHLSETVKEHEECKMRHGKTPARWFYDLGVLDCPTIAAHCVMVEPEDIEILREKGVACVHNPSSNMKLGSGFMPIYDMLQKGVHLCIGTDGAASNNNLNMFEEMHLASIIHNGRTNDPTILKPREILTMATINGAKAQQRENCGAIAVGNKADIIAINLDKPHLMPNHDTLALLTYSAQGSDVDMTMINGKIVYRNGEFLTIDAEKVKFDLEASCRRLLQ